MASLTLLRLYISNSLPIFHFLKHFSGFCLGLLISPPHFSISITFLFPCDYISLLIECEPDLLNREAEFTAFKMYPTLNGQASILLSLLFWISFMRLPQHHLLNTFTSRKYINTHKLHTQGTDYKHPDLHRKFFFHIKIKLSIAH